MDRAKKSYCELMGAQSLDLTTSFRDI